MLSGRIVDKEVIVKIVDTGNFELELKQLKNIGGTFRWTTKEWVFDVQKLGRLEAIGVRFGGVDVSGAYPEAYVNRDRVPWIRDYQVEPLRFMLSHNGRILLADDVGVGKTLSSISFFAYTKINYPLLIITTASMKSQWEREYNRFNEWGTKTHVCEGFSSVHAMDADVVIMNYDLLSTQLVNVSTDKWKPKYEATEGLKSLKGMNFQGLIIDECQRIKSDTAMWTKSIQYLGRDIPHILALSATPVENKPIEFFNVLNLLRPDLWYDYDAFGMQYCDGKKAYRWESRGKKKIRKEYMDYKGISHEEELFRALRHHVMFRRSRREVFPNLRALPIPLPLRMDAEATREYASIVSGETDIYTKAGKKIKKGNAAVQKNYLKEFCANQKIEYVIQFLKDFLQDTDDKIIVFTEHHSVIDALHAKFPKDSLVYDGRCTLKQKDKTKQAFIDGDTRILFGQIKSMGEGLDGLQNVCHKMMIVEMPYNPMLIVQAIGRLERTGTTADSVDVYLPILLGTVEDDILDMIVDKSTNVFSILDGEDGKLMNIGRNIHDHLDAMGLDTD